MESNVRYCRGQANGARKTAALHADGTAGMACGSAAGRRPTAEAGSPAGAGQQGVTANPVHRISLRVIPARHPEAHGSNGGRQRRPVRRIAGGSATGRMTACCRWPKRVPGIPRRATTDIIWSDRHPAQAGTQGAGCNTLAYCVLRAGSTGAAARHRHALPRLAQAIQRRQQRLIGFDELADTFFLQRLQQCR